MPYIHPDRRELFDDPLAEIASNVMTEGEFNYCVYKLATLITARMGESYDVLSMCGSAMEHAKLEWYRRRVAPYEDMKIEQNGDIT